MSFQYSAFQESAFQMDVPTGGYGDKKHKFDSEAYAEVYNHADRLRRRIEQLPEAVQEVIAEAVEIPQESVRLETAKQGFSNIDLKFQRVYFALLEQYYQAILDDELKKELLLAEQRRRQADDEAAIMLLLLS